MQLCQLGAGHTLASETSPVSWAPAAASIEHKCIWRKHDFETFKLPWCELPVCFCRITGQKAVQNCCYCVSIRSQLGSFFSPGIHSRLKLRNICRLIDFHCSRVQSISHTVVCRFRNLTSCSSWVQMNCAGTEVKTAVAVFQVFIFVLSSADAVADFLQKSICNNR